MLLEMCPRADLSSAPKVGDVPQTRTSAGRQRGVSLLIEEAVTGTGQTWLSTTSLLNSWLAPVILFIVVIVAAWAGLRWIRSENVETLSAVPLFSGLSRQRLMAALRSAHGVDFPPGEHIVEEGSTSGGFYVMTEGEARVTVGGREVARLPAGSYFGEVAVIDGGPRSATITAATRVNTLEFTPAALKSLLRKDPAIEASMAAEFRRRLGSAASADDSASLEDLCGRLRQAQQPDWVPQPIARRRGFRRTLVPRSG
jgi:CRP/FNR family transcriptional regulator, cyclic AMP receptor protein